jgi:hypothetical protein
LTRLRQKEEKSVPLPRRQAGARVRQLAEKEGKQLTANSGERTKTITITITLTMTMTEDGSRNRE